MIVKAVQRYGQVCLGSALLQNFPGVVTMTPAADGILIAPVTDDDLHQPDKCIVIISAHNRVTLPIKFRRQYQIESSVELHRLPDGRILVRPYSQP